jgi:hypothetical protein
MATYKLKDDFVNGVLPNTNGKPNIIFKKGDIINGTITEKFVFNTMMKGIMSKPTVVGARVEEAGGLVFVPITSIDLVNQPVVKQLQSKEEVQKLIDERISKIKFPLKTTLITSAVPLGLAYYSYYNNYSLTKGIGVVVIGSVVAFYGTIMFSGRKFV